MARSGSVLHGFHRSIAAFAAAGLDLVVEHVIEQASWAEQLRDALRPFDVFWVGVRVPLNVLEDRERVRGDRSLGEASEHFGTHDHCVYDMEIENVGSPIAVAEQVVRFWKLRLSSDL